MSDSPSSWVSVWIVAQESHKDSAKCVRIVPSADVEARGDVSCIVMYIFFVAATQVSAMLFHRKVLNIMSESNPNFKRIEMGCMKSCIQDFSLEVPQLPLPGGHSCFG